MYNSSVLISSSSVAVSIYALLHRVGRLVVVGSSTLHYYISFSRLQLMTCDASTGLAEVEERRREQNRLAQRRFRRKYTLLSGHELNRWMTTDLERSRHLEKHRKRKSVDQHQRTRSLDSDAQSPEDAVLPEARDTSGLDDKRSLTSLHDPIAPGVDTLVVPDNMEFGNIGTLWMTGPGFDPAPNFSQIESSKAKKNEEPLECSPCIDSDVLWENLGGDGTATYTPKSNHEGRFRASTLHTAVQKGNGRIVRLLLEHGADCNSKDAAGFTPLLHATIGGYEEVTDLLLSYGAGYQHVDDCHRSALHWAVIHGRERLLQKLLKHCAGNCALVNGYTIEGRTALHIAVEMGFEPAVELLLEHGAKID